MAGGKHMDHELARFQAAKAQAEQEIMNDKPAIVHTNVVRCPCGREVRFEIGVSVERVDGAKVTDLKLQDFVVGEATKKGGVKVTDGGSAAPTLCTLCKKVADDPDLVYWHGQPYHMQCVMVAAEKVGGDGKPEGLK